MTKPEKRRSSDPKRPSPIASRRPCRGAAGPEPARLSFSCNGARRESLRDCDQAPGLHRHGDGGAHGARRSWASRASAPTSSPTSRSPSSSSTSPYPGASPREVEQLVTKPHRGRGRLAQRHRPPEDDVARGPLDDDHPLQARRRPPGRGDRRCASASRRRASSSRNEVKEPSVSALRRRRRAGPHVHAERRRPLAPRDRRSSRATSSSPRSSRSTASRRSR